MEIEKAKRLTEIYEKRIEEFSTGHSGLKRLDCGYENVTDEPEKWVEKLINSLDIKTTRNQYQKAINFILPKDEIRELAKGRKFKDGVQDALSLVKSGAREP